MKMLASNCSYFSLKEIWKSKAPTKTYFLASVTFKGKVPTEVMLKKRNLNLASRCPMCLDKDESIDHLFVSIVIGPHLFGLSSFLDGNILGSIF